MYTTHSTQIQFFYNKCNVREIIRCEQFQHQHEQTMINSHAASFTTAEFSWFIIHVDSKNIEIDNILTVSFLSLV